MGRRGRSERGLRAALALPMAALGLVVARPDLAAAQESMCHDQWAAWSPDGHSVVFVSTVTGDHEVHTVSLGTGHVVQLTDTPGRDAHPSFSPDGRRIAFQSPRGGDGTHLYVMNRDGTSVRRVTNLPGTSGMPIWSPDGDQLAFQHRAQRTDKWQLHVVRLSDGDVRSLSDGVANDQVVNWSPDGRRLAFHSDRSGTNQVYLWEAGEVRQVTHGPHEHRNAAWAPGGGTLAVRSTLGGAPGIYLLRLGDQDLTRVGTVEVDHGVPFVSPDGSQLLLTPMTPDGTRMSTVAVNTGAIQPLRGACPAAGDRR